jgi:hypothetical protein
VSRCVQELLEAARRLEVAEPPPLAAIRTEVGARTQRTTQWMAFAVAIPLGAAAAAGGWVVRERVVRPATVEHHRMTSPAPAPRPAAPLPAPEPMLPASIIDDAPAAAPAAHHLEVPAPRPVAVARASTPAAARDAVVPAPGGPADTVPVAGAPAATPRETPAASAPVAPTALSEEATLLSEALAALRTQHDPQAALDAVVRYRARFPQGVLASEVTLAAVEAHRSVGHTAEALTELERLSSDPLRGELAVLRAELRAELGQCADARRELAASLDSLPAALRPRALFTDATCAATLGARDDAVARLEALLALDPTDARARALLEQLK